MEFWTTVADYWAREVFNARNGIWNPIFISPEEWLLAKRGPFMNPEGDFPPLMMIRKRRGEDHAAYGRGDFGARYLDADSWLVFKIYPEDLPV